MSQKSRQQSIRAISDALIELRRLERAGAAAGSGCSVSPAQGALVHEVAGAGDAGITTSTLASRLGISSSAVTQLVDGLVEGGLLRRETDPSDRRRVQLLLTECGHRLYREFDDLRLGQAASMLEELDDAELGELAGLLGKVTRQK